MATKSKNIKKITTVDYVKACRHGEFMAMNENQAGFVAMHKTHKSKKAYDRKRDKKIEF